MKLKRALLVFVPLCGIFLALAWMTGTARSAQIPSPPPVSDQPGQTETDHLVVVRIRAATFNESQRLVAAGLDLLHARDGDDLFAIVTPQEQASLRAAGWQVRLDAEQTALLHRSSLQAFRGEYQTVEEVETFLQDVAEITPTLTSLVDFGDSWERQQSDGAAGYDLWALRLTNEAIPGPKPVFFLMATIHAREIATAEVATRFIQYLLTNYGTDPDVTWLLDEYELVVVPMVNPDGHKLAEQGYMQRKNTNPGDGSSTCPDPPRISSHYGVDLNRNFAYQWGIIDSPGMSVCSPTFPGTEAASEPETQALQTLIQSLYPDRPRPGDGTAVPYTTTGVLISLHSYSELVLWPWGYSRDPAPDAAALEQLGRRLAAFNDYTPSQSIGLYPTSGTIEDWSYGELGIASFTFEIGPFSGECGGFMPPHFCLDGGDGGNFWQRNLPALLYAARVTRAPYTQPSVPDIITDSIEIVSDTTMLTLTLTLDDATDVITAAEVYVGASPWRGGVPIAMQPVSDTLHTNVQRWRAGVSVNLLQAACASENAATCLAADEGDLPLLLVRGSNAEGLWGPMRPVWPVATPVLEPDIAPSYRVWVPLVVR